MIAIYVLENWEKLPKSNFDDKELVIVREIENDEEGYGHHYYEGIGVDSEGKVFRVTSSGCSCSGGPSWDEIGESELTENWEDVEFDCLQVSFDSY